MDPQPSRASDDSAKARAEVAAKAAIDVSREETSSHSSSANDKVSVGKAEHIKVHPDGRIEGKNVEKLAHVVIEQRLGKNARGKAVRVNVWTWIALGAGLTGALAWSVYSVSIRGGNTESFASALVQYDELARHKFFTDAPFAKRVAAWRDYIVDLCYNYEREATAVSTGDSMLSRKVARDRKLLEIDGKDFATLKPDMKSLEVLLDAAAKSLADSNALSTCVLDIRNRTVAFEQLVHIFNEWLAVPRTAQYATIPKTIESLEARAAPDGDEQLLLLGVDARNCLQGY